MSVFGGSRQSGQTWSSCGRRRKLVAASRRRAVHPRGPRGGARFWRVAIKFAAPLSGEKGCPAGGKTPVLARLGKNFSLHQIATRGVSKSINCAFKGFNDLNFLQRLATAFFGQRRCDAASENPGRILLQSKKSRHKMSSFDRSERHSLRQIEQPKGEPFQFASQTPEQTIN